MTNAERAGAVLTIDLDAVAANYRLLRDRIGSAECGAVVKADGYGLGAEQLAARLYAEGCRQFFVAQLDEGAAIRSLVPDAAVYILNGLQPAWAKEYAEGDVIPILNDPGQIAAWSAYCREHGPRPAMIHFDTGMTRLGLERREVGALSEDPEQLAPFSDVMIMSHLACADDADHAHNTRQLEEFRKIARRFKACSACFANSSGIFLGPDFHFDLVRPGYALWGGNPVPGQPNPMKSVVRLAGRILQLREIDTPRHVGYGSTHRAEKRTRIATVAVGYA
ncbi:MAG: alanine racemase, partial [Methyloligellaceae bacterium]